jgi:hypothetical protein
MKLNPVSTFSGKGQPVIITMAECPQCWLVGESATHRLKYQVSSFELAADESFSQHFTPAKI